MQLNRTTADIASNRPVKVLQFGEGNFLRAFADWIIDKLNEEAGFNGDVQIIQPLRNGMGDLINAQDGLYHVLLNGLRDGKPVEEFRLIQSVRGVINPYENFDAFLQTGENPDLQIVLSNTTEAGIAFDPGDTDPDSLAVSFPGKLTTWLFHRFRFFHGAHDKAVTVIPCELTDRNGSKLRDVITEYIRLWKLPDAFMTWVREYTTFCNTLVDRIVPGFPKENTAGIHEAIGFEDKLVVIAEPFHLWVIEGPERVRDLFPLNNTGLDVLFVKDLTPYRDRKVRILNGAHTTIVPVAYLHGLRTVRDAVEDPFAGPFLKETIEQEIMPTLDLPADELSHFAHSVIERFRNPFVRHELKSIALNSISKYSVRVLPSLLEYVGRFGSLPSRLTFSLACLIRFYKGDWHGAALPVNDADDVMEFFRKMWATGNADKVAVGTLSNSALWDRDLTSVPGLCERVTADLDLLRDNDVATAWKTRRDLANFSKP